MRHVAKLASIIGLVATIAPSILVFAGVVGLDLGKWLTLLGTIIWFVATPNWMGQELPLDAAEVEI